MNKIVKYLLTVMLTGSVVCSSNTVIYATEVNEITNDVVVDGVERVVAFIRDAKKVVIKNDMLLSPVDMQHVKLELSKFIKKVEDTKKAKRK